MDRRYERNVGAISREENELLRGKKVCVAGCGGLGGGVIEGLARVGVGYIRAVDGDVFDETNLNRQLLSSEKNLGKSKAEEAVRRIGEINSQVDAEAVGCFIDDSNAAEILKGVDAVVDALDDAGARLIVEAACEKLGIPLIHGAIGGWNGQVAVVMPGDRMMDILYGSEFMEKARGDEEKAGNPYFTPAVISAIQVAETVKVLAGRDSVLRNSLLMIDLLDHQYEIVAFGE